MENFETFTSDLKSQLKWIVENSSEKISGLKQQKFILFYNLFAKVENKPSNFTGLCAWEDGPVYTQIYAAVKHHYTINEIIESLDNPIPLDETLANITKFILNILSDKQISKLTHEFSFWKTAIVNEDENNIIKEEYITTRDLQKIKKILKEFDLNFILKHEVYKTSNAVFLIPRENYDFIINKYENKLKEIKHNKPIKIQL